MHKSLQVRYREHIIKHELPQKLLRQPEAPLNLDQSQETWKKKEECFPSTKSKFFSVPHKIPAPQKMRIKKDVEVETSSSDACQPPADGLHVVEQIQMLLKKKEHTELLVAIVRSPNQDLEFLLHPKEFNALRPHEQLFGEWKKHTDLYTHTAKRQNGRNRLQNYITEKLWRNALLSGAAPVVLGPPRENYELFLPAEAFIHVKDFSGPRALAAYLKHLDRNHSLYQRYLNWLRHYSVHVTSFWAEHYCMTCRAVQASRHQNKSVSDIALWFES
ncbi:Alpha-(1,3)-fucosyltransferase 4 [Anabarilius grahami]|uniref:Fucosyltransferase n=1 Tax=Anabarilius grahami TaxID=495550 RepID=A0A3N0XQV6_ANAGA|nr:Alpha-(1,3)-fucosyltransferase 4 [Anabarilius grahami]